MSSDDNGDSDTVTNDGGKTSVFCPMLNHPIGSGPQKVASQPSSCPWTFQHEEQFGFYAACQSVVRRDRIRLAIMACATKTRTSGCRPNEIATVRYLRRAVAVERRAEGDLTGHHFRLNCPRTVAF